MKQKEHLLRAKVKVEKQKKSESSYLNNLSNYKVELESESRKLNLSNKYPLKR